MPPSMKDCAYVTVIGLGLVAHTDHESVLPACRRKEHAEEKPAVQATDLGMTLNVRAATTSEALPTFVETHISQPLPAPRRAPAEAYFAPVGVPPQEGTPLSWLQ
jgi:hypothetical protein